MSKVSVAARRAALWLIACTCVACVPAGRTATLRADVVPNGNGAVIGHVSVFHKGADITSSCRIELRDDEHRTVVAPLADDGWVLASLPLGGANLFGVRCDGRRFSYRTYSLGFGVQGEGRTTYFGHVRFDVESEAAIIDVPPGAREDAIRQGKAVPTTLHPTVQSGIAYGTMLAIDALIASTAVDGDDGSSVENKVYEAVDAYRARYNARPAQLVVSLAGATFSEDAAITNTVHRQGEMLYTEARVNGVALTWLGLVGLSEQKAALRVQRFLRKDEACDAMQIVADGKAQSWPILTKSERASTAVKQTAQAEVGIDAIRAMAGAKRVSVRVCSTTRELSPTARGAAIHFANAYQDMQQELPPAAASPPAVAAASSAPAPVSAAEPAPPPPP